MGVYQEKIPFCLLLENYMFKEIKINFVDDNRTNYKVLKKKPKTRKKRIVKKWFKKYSVSIPDTKGCSIIGYAATDDGGMVVFAVAHPLAKESMEKMNSMNDGNQPFFTWD